MTEVNLSNSSKQFAVKVYKEYKRRADSGMDERNARGFVKPEVWEALFPDWHHKDIESAATALCKAFEMKRYFGPGFTLSEEFICYMEDRTKNTLKEIWEQVSKIGNFIP